MHMLGVADRWVDIKRCPDKSYCRVDHSFKDPSSFYDANQQGSYIHLKQHIKQTIQEWRKSRIGNNTA